MSQFHHVMLVSHFLFDYSQVPTDVGVGRGMCLKCFSLNALAHVFVSICIRVHILVYIALYIYKETYIVHRHTPLGILYVDIFFVYTM